MRPAISAAPAPPPAAAAAVVREDTESILAACSADLRLLCGRTLLVTGASGFVGSYLVESICAWNAAQSNPCTLLFPVRSPAAARRRFAPLFQTDATPWIAWPPGRDLCQVIDRDADFIIHAASPADPAGYRQDAHGCLVSIADLTRQVVEYAKRASAQRILYISSGAVYGQQPSHLAAIPESYTGSPHLGSPSACYAEAKRYSELLCQTSAVDTVVARLFCFLGPYQSLNASFAAPNFLCQAIRDGQIRLDSDGSALRTFCYSSDLAICLWKLLLRGRAGDIVNVGSGEPVVSILELARAIARHVGGVPVKVLPAGKDETAAHSRYIPDITRLHAFYSPAVSLDDAIARTVRAHATETQRNL
ncbi:MAG TPA: NAD(P)-dependent oxidoreductase [Terriglobales bacterium]|nr:NAD(P)-dependent oxidoreductase [Terriglobales bacterium]